MILDWPHFCPFTSNNLTVMESFYFIAKDLIGFKICLIFTTYHTKIFNVDRLKLDQYLNGLSYFPSNWGNQHGLLLLVLIVLNKSRRNGDSEEPHA